MDIRDQMVRAGLDEDTITRLLDGGFDDLESISLAEVDTLKLLGFTNPDELHQKLRHMISNEEDDLHESMAQGVLE